MGFFKKDFFNFVKKSKKKIAELIFTHLLSASGITGFFLQNWFEDGTGAFHTIMVILALVVLLLVPPATWYRIYRVYKKAKKYVEEKAND